MAAAVMMGEGSPVYSDRRETSNPDARNAGHVSDANGGLRGIFGLLTGGGGSDGSNGQSAMSLPSKQLEYLFEDEYAPSGPSWGARICYGAGITYLTGLSIGGSWGLVDGLRNPAGRASSRLRLNCILNSCTARGPFVANNLAMVALLYNLVHGAVIKARKGQQADEVSATASAAAAGLIYKSSRGLRAMGKAGLLLGTGMATFQLAKRYYNANYLIS